MAAGCDNGTLGGDADLFLVSAANNSVGLDLAVLAQHGVTDDGALLDDDTGRA